jgi:hypothetical protein
MLRLTTPDAKEIARENSNVRNAMQERCDCPARRAKIFASVFQKNMIVLRHPASMLRAYRDRHDT